MAVVSSHTLDALDGSHAGGIAVRLANLTNGVVLFDTHMDDAGRLSQQLEITETDAADIYELVFDTGHYWRHRGVTHRDLVEQVVLRFAMPDAAARYHRPLIISPNGYSMWNSIAEPDHG